MKFITAAALGAISALTASPAFAQQCGGDFATWMKGVESQASARGVGQKGISALEHADLSQKVLNMDRGQAVFSQTFTEFANRMINNYRLVHGRENLKKYADTFARAKQQFGVSGPVIAAFWALETDFGAVQGNFSTLDALTTLSFDCRRPDLFRPQLIALLELIDRRVVPANVEGAWAGEIGQMQTLPTDYLENGVDGDGDGRVDLKDSAPDAIMTAAKKLNVLGWKAGQPWLDEVRVPDDLPWKETGRVNRLPRSKWAALGVTRADGSPLPADGLPAGLILPMGHNGPAFLAYDNYDVYLGWNKSLVYTLTAANLASRLDGAEKFDPRHPDEGLAPETMKELQRKLEAKGYDVGEVDGVLGVNTRDAVRQEQLRLGFPADGWPTPALLANM